MEKKFSIPPVRIAAHPLLHDRLAIGFIDGSIGFYKFHVADNQMEILQGKQQRSSIRQLAFSNGDGEHLYSICGSKALCCYDVETNQRIRCILRCHDDKPNDLCSLPSLSTKGQQLATGDETGQIRTWDLRMSNPQISNFNDLEDTVNELAVVGPTLLAACSDGTLGAYDLRRRKLMVRSEPMSSELLSIASTNSHTFVGNGRGYLEVFKRNEYGNILERIETTHSMGVDCICAIRDDLLLTSSNESPDIRLIHVNPNKMVGSLGVHEQGVQQMCLTSDHFWMVSIGWLKPTVKFWNIPHIVDKIPIMRPSDVSKRKRKTNVKKISNNFFDGLREKASDSEDSDNDKNDESEDEDEDDDDEDENEYKESSKGNKTAEVKNLKGKTPKGKNLQKNLPKRQQQQPSVSSRANDDDDDDESSDYSYDDEEDENLEEVQSSTEESALISKLQAQRLKRKITRNDEGESDVMQEDDSDEDDDDEEEEDDEEDEDDEENSDDNEEDDEEEEEDEEEEDEKEPKDSDEGDSGDSEDTGDDDDDVGASRKGKRAGGLPQKGDNNALSKGKKFTGGFSPQKIPAKTFPKKAKFQKIKGTAKRKRVS